MKGSDWIAAAFVFLVFGFCYRNKIPPPVAHWLAVGVLLACGVVKMVFEYRRRVEDRKERRRDERNG